MPTITIDDEQFHFEPGDKLLQFCLDMGLEIPHFCYHPAMSIPANCRQCYVEVGMPVMDRESGKPQLDEQGQPMVQFLPKLQTSCSVEMADGMVVRTHRSSDLVMRAQRDTLEFLLLNHPLDCPICDQAGECPLQNLTYKYGPEGSRFEFHKVHKPKHVRLGPNVVLDAERCINCTRCTRFTDEVSKSGQLSIISRGDKNYPMTAPGQVFDDPYSLNTVDLCPVGALTSAHFRFKARVWEMSSTPSITTDCSKGSNCFYWVRDNLIMRITPRTNLQVNEYWLPDSARLDFQKYNENRPEGPQLRSSDGTLVPAGWDETYDRAAAILRENNGSIAFLGSAYATVEDNYLLRRLARATGSPTPRYIEHVEPGSGDGFLVADDKTPNAAGCARLGIEPIEGNDLRNRIASGQVKVLYVMEDDPVASGLLTPEDLGGVKIILHFYNTTNRTLQHASVAFPASTVVETIGTYVNEDGIAQRVRPAKATKNINRRLMMEMGRSRLDSQGTPFDRWFNEDHMVDCRPGWETIPQIARRVGQRFEYAGPAAVMEEITRKMPPFSGATYEEMGLTGVRLAEAKTPA